MKGGDSLTISGRQELKMNTAYNPASGKKITGRGRYPKGLKPTSLPTPLGQKISCRSYQSYFADIGIKMNRPYGTQRHAYLRWKPTVSMNWSGGEYRPWAINYSPMGAINRLYSKTIAQLVGNSRLRMDTFFTPSIGGR